MPLSTTTTRITYTGNGVTTVFSYPFRILDATHLRVSLNGLVQTSGFSITGVNANAGGTVVFSVAPANGAVVLLERVLPLTQPVDTVNNETILENVIDTGFDRLTMQVQQVDTKAGRALRLLDSDPFATDFTIPTTDVRKGGFLYFNAVTGAAEIAQPGGSLVVNDVAPTVAVFSGTGSQQVFTLPTTVALTSLSYIFISGVYQQKSRYSIVGSQLTFVTAPPAGTNNIEVVLLPSYALAGSIIAGSISDSSVVGRAVLRAVDAAAARSAIDALATTGGTMTGALTLNTTDALRVPAGTTAQRPAGTTGQFRFNSTTGNFEGFNGTTWGSVGGGATGAGGDQTFYLNAQTITTSYSIPSGQNAGTFGPVTVASGAVVTVPSGSTWTVV